MTVFIDIEGSETMTQNNNDKGVFKASTSDESLTLDDSWIKKIWEWADNFELLGSEVPREKKALKNYRIALGKAVI